MFHALAAGLASIALMFTGPLLVIDDTQYELQDVELQVVGGSIAKTNPGAVVLVDEGGQVCTASQIAPEWVLTAAHCTDIVNNSSKIRVGSLKWASGGKLVGIDSTYTDDTNPGDIALIKLSQPVTGYPMAKLTDADPAVGARVDIYGWGMTSGFSGPSPVLKTAETKRLDYPGQKDHKDGAALILKKVSGMAHPGDSGGPAFSDGKQVGVCSNGDDKTLMGYASVANHREWIRSTSGV